MRKKIFGSYKNTSVWFQEFKKSIKSDIPSLLNFETYLKGFKLGFKFPGVVYKDFITLTKTQKIFSLSIFLIFISVITILNSELEKINEENILKCDCSTNRDNDPYYSYWYYVGYDYGTKIPTLVNVERNINQGTKYGKSYFSRDWIKNWILTKGSQNMRGIPNMKKYLECWEKGYLEGRNKLFNEN